MGILKRMAINKEAKNKVIDDWQNAFPQLSLYARDKLYKIAGPIIIGLELIKLPRTPEYRPHFVVYPIWKQDVSTSLDFPIILKEYFDKKGFQYDIPYEKHDAFFNDVLESIDKQTLLLFDGNISFNKISSVIDEYSKTQPLSAAPNSYFQAELLAAKLKIALVISIEEAQNILEQVTRKSWDISHFQACGMDLSKWLQSLQKNISNRDDF
jgi:hypothetical protein